MEPFSLRVQTLSVLLEDQIVILLVPTSSLHHLFPFWVCLFTISFTSNILLKLKNSILKGQNEKVEFISAGHYHSVMSSIGPEGTFFGTGYNCYGICNERRKNLKLNFPVFIKFKGQLGMGPNVTENQFAFQRKQFGLWF